MLGQVDKSILMYDQGLQIQIQTLGETDPRVIVDWCLREKFKLT